MSAVGETIDARYWLERRLGVSAGTDVFLAEDLSLQRSVAVRVAGPDGAASLDRQISVLRSLNYATSHAVAVLDEGVTAEGGRYLVAPFIDGTEVDRLVIARGPLPADQAASIGEQLLEATEVARRVYPDGRDAIPEGAILDRDGEVRVTRFRPVSATGVDDQVCPAIGATLHSLLTGVPPQVGESVRDHGRVIPDEVADVVDAALNGRIRDGAEMRRRLADARRRIPRAAAAAPAPSRPWHMIVAVAAIVVVLAVIAVIAFVALGNDSSGPTVPDVVGQDVAAATSAIQDAGLRPLVVGDQQTGVVVSTSPAAGTEVDDNSQVKITLGPGTASVPNVVGLTEDAARSAVTDAGLVLGVVTNRPSPTVPQGQVISQQPSGGTTVDGGSSVAVVVSQGEAASAVPDVVGQTLPDAVNTLQSAGFSSGTVTQDATSSEPANTVVQQTPAAGVQLVNGGRVALVVSQGGGATTTSP